jgi:hypothetical protein
MIHVLVLPTRPENALFNFLLHKFLSLLRFPFRHPDLVTKWTAITGVTPQRRSTVCSLHFNESDIDRTGQIIRLRDGALPTTKPKRNCEVSFKFQQEY